MILRLDPLWPLVWRDPFTVQIGIDPPRVVLHEVTATDERMLAALAVGVTREGLALISNGETNARDALLEQLEPVLHRSSDHPRQAVVVVSGRGRLVDLTASLLGESGVRVVVAADALALADHTPDLAVAIGHWVLPPELHSLWLRRDIPHVPAVLSDSAIQVGPIVEPGLGPCLVCIELHRRDEDAAWPAIATQLLSRAPAPTPAVLITEAATALCRLVMDRLNSGQSRDGSLRIDLTGDRTTRSWRPHPDCGCQGIAHLLEESRVGTPGLVPRAG